MATLKTNLIEPEGATTTLTVGESGGNLVMGADSLKANTLKSRTNPTATSFTAVESTTWTAPTGITSVEYLVVGGGGGGGGTLGGGGGAGGFRTGTMAVTPGAQYTVTVGAGGAGAGTTANNGTDGDDSVFSTITSIGGGGGGSDSPEAGRAGSSGGGGGTDGGPSAAGTGGAGTAGQGNAGGDAYDSSPTFAGGGGGGSTGVGIDAATGGAGGGGGVGTASSITGSSVTYAGGGGGCGRGTGATGGTGGSGGGGNGSSDANGSGAVATAGTANTGGGGGGGDRTSPASSAAGGSGVVIVKYTLPTGTPQTLFVSNGSGVVSSVDSGWGGVQVLLSTQTASNSASISFTTGIDSTYEEYIFEFIDINPQTESVYFSFQANASGQTGYNEVMTTTTFIAQNREDGGGTSQLIYRTANDQAQGTAYQLLAQSMANGADECLVGELHLFAPASTTYVKNFYATCQHYQDTPGSQESFTAGYFNVTAAITNIDFKMSSGNIVAGTIKMYGIK